MKPFNLQAALAGAPVVTRDGRPVNVLAHFTNPVINENYRLAALVSGTSVPTFYGKEGVYAAGSTNDLDLFMAPVKKTVYVNFYSHEVVGKKGIRRAYWHETEASARGVADHDAIAVAVPVEIEVDHE